MNDPVGRVEFARHLYELLHVKVDEDTTNATSKLNNMISKCHGMKSFYTHDSQGPNSARTGDSDGADGRGGGASDYPELRAHGYEVKPEVIVAGGVALEPLFEV